MIPWSCCSSPPLTLPLFPSKPHTDPDKRLEIRLLAVLGEREDNDGVFEFRTWDARRRPGGDYSDIEAFEMGAVAVAVSNNRNM